MLVLYSLYLFCLILVVGLQLPPANININNNKQLHTIATSMRGCRQLLHLGLFIELLASPVSVCRSSTALSTWSKWLVGYFYGNNNNSLQSVLSLILRLAILKPVGWHSFVPKRACCSNKLHSRCIRCFSPSLPSSLSLCFSLADCLFLFIYLFIFIFWRIKLVTLLWLAFDKLYFPLLWRKYATVENFASLTH